jgi:hypothetical protein
MPARSSKNQKSIEKEPKLGVTLLNLKLAYDRKEDKYAINELLDITKRFLQQKIVREAMKAKAAEGWTYIALYDRKTGFLLSCPKNTILSMKAEEFHKNYGNKGVILKKDRKIAEYDLTITESFSQILLCWPSYDQ